ncbi:hypothetical protein LMH87_003920 [Akanthomyces muscarius]|uniref:Uncharacterized protein n=1 Tax=Akanthomyces muscarius TaxID=2231603 RepID=A0A9W8Q4D8_AKAMU|nr:hypothetical protein LMH87_003920 [Akanthomyces muscarius]KAJ4145059.1 hypothetical protein LMH87_003920 [Akanthomyces muscarius]
MQKLNWLPISTCFRQAAAITTIRETSFPEYAPQPDQPAAGAKPLYQIDCITRLQLTQTAPGQHAVSLSCSRSKLCFEPYFACI